MKKQDLKEQYSTRIEAEKALATYNKDKSEEEKLYYTSYFSAIKNKWMYCICTKQQWHQNEAMKRDEAKRIDEESRCLVYSKRYGYKKCREKCDECPYGKSKRDGNPLSYDQAIEDGMIPDGKGGMKPFKDQADTSSNSEPNIFDDVLLDSVNQLLDELSSEDRTIIDMFANRKSDAEIAKTINSKKSTVQYRRTKIITELKIKIEKYL